MDDVFFGQYLVNKSIITSTELLQCVAYQKGRNRLLGELALDLKMLTNEQIAHVMTLQRDRDVMFGDAVVELGYIKREQLDDLLRIQKRTHVFLGEVVVKMNFAKSMDVYKALQDFELEYRSGKARPRATLGGSEDAWIDALAALTQKTLTRSFNVPSRLGTRDSFPKGTEIPLFRWSAGSTVTAPWQGMIVFSASERVTTSIMQGQSGEEKPLAADRSSLAETVQEAATIICRLGKGSLSLQIESEPRHMEQRSISLAVYRGVVAELVTPAGAAHLIATFK